MAAQPEQKLPLDNIAGLDKVTTKEFIKLAMTDDYREGVADSSHLNTLVSLVNKVDYSDIPNPHPIYITV